MSIPVNFWAVIISALCSVILGFLWYGPLFGKQWMRLSGIAIPDPKPPASAMVKPMLYSVIAAIFMAYILSHVITFSTFYLGSSGVSAGLSSAFWTWLGFVVPICLAPTAWENKPWKLFFLNAGYWLVLLSIMGMIIATWR